MSSMEDIMVNGQLTRQTVVIIISDSAWKREFITTNIIKVTQIW